MDWHLGVAAATATVSMTLGMINMAEHVVEATSPPAVEAYGEAPEYVHPGELVLIDWTVTRRSACPDMVSRIWRGADGFALAEPLKPAISAATNQPIEYRIPTAIPNLSPPGKLELYIEHVFTCPGSEAESVTVGPVQMEVLDYGWNEG